MRLQFVGVVGVSILLAGCARPPEVSVASTELKFRSCTSGVATFDARIRAGDSLCWQHGDDGAITNTRWESDQIVVFTVSDKGGRLEIASNNGILESIPVESVVLVEHPQLKDDRFYVGKYVRTLGAAKAPECPLYVYAKAKE